MQQATLIYNERIYLHRRMVEIDAIIDREPTVELVKELAETRIRNLKCFRELEALNDKGELLNEHPLLTTRTERDELMNLFRNEPDEFLKRYKLSADNINRYRSRLNSSKYSDDKKRQFRELINEHQTRLDIIKEIMQKHR